MFAKWPLNNPKSVQLTAFGASIETSGWKSDFLDWKALFYSFFIIYFHLFNIKKNMADLQILAEFYYLQWDGSVQFLHDI